MRLAAAIPQRQTNRRPYGSMAIRPAVLDELVRAASAEDGVLVFADPDQRRELLAALLRAEEQLRISPAYRAELTAWTTASPGSGDGIPPESFGPRPELAALAVRDFDPGHAYPRRVARFEADPVLAVLFTSGDEPADWLRAGQALERVLLTATVHGVASAPLTQLVEVAALRQLVSVPGPGLIAQSMLRLGYASRVRATPRRPLSDILVH
jgi:hypothetical protein